MVRTSLTGPRISKSGDANRARIVSKIHLGRDSGRGSGVWLGFVRRSLVGAAAVGAGGGAPPSFEGVSEGGFGAVADAGGDFLDGDGAITKQVAGFAHPQGGEVLQGRLANHLAELSGKDGARHGDFLGQGGDGPIELRLGVHEAQGAADSGIAEGAHPTAGVGGKRGDVGADGLDEKDVGQAVDDGLGAGQVLGGFAGNEAKGVGEPGSGISLAANVNDRREGAQERAGPAAMEDQAAGNELCHGLADL